MHYTSLFAITLKINVCYNLYTISINVNSFGCHIYRYYELIHKIFIVFHQKSTQIIVENAIYFWCVICEIKYCREWWNLISKAVNDRKNKLKRWILSYNITSNFSSYFIWADRMDVKYSTLYIKFKKGNYSWMLSDIYKAVFEGWNVWEKIGDEFSQQGCSQDFFFFLRGGFSIFFCMEKFGEGFLWFFSWKP